MHIRILEIFIPLFRCSTIHYFAFSSVPEDTAFLWCPGSQLNLYSTWELHICRTTQLELVRLKKCNAPYHLPSFTGRYKMKTGLPTSGKLLFLCHWPENCCGNCRGNCRGNCHGNCHGNCRGKMT